ncbi:DUF3486 family protein [Luteimonas soli]|uniref:DUF3486 family protein n=1 Tax=Luteimonas soli TaxID=1648966 RepID=A0ABV7XKY1_9GAMM
MAPRSKVDQLPEAVRQELEQKLIANGFGGYEALTEWLTEQGFEISKSSVHRWGSDFEERVDALRIATQQAKAIVKASPDDEGDMSEALMRLMQERIFSALVSLEVDPKKVNLGSLAKALAPIARASIAQKKYASEVRDRARAAVEAVDRIASSGGLTADGAKQLREQILGIGGQAS